MSTVKSQSAHPEIFTACCCQYTMSSTRQGALSLAHSSVSIAQVTAWLEDLCWGDYSLSCYYKSNIFTIGFFFLWWVFMR
jgi:hypothetical protein